MTLSQKPPPVQVDRDPTVPVARQARPVLWWASIGLLATAFVIYLGVRWLGSDDSDTIDTGPTDVPTFMRVNAHVQEVLGLIILVGVLYHFVYRPIRREHRLSWDGMFFISALGLVWQDQLQNVFGIHVLTNTEFVNWGSWYNFIPGWIPDQRPLSEPVLWMTVWYGYAILFGAIASNWVMRRAKQRWPEIGNVGLVGICFTLLFVVIVPAEISYMALGMYCYPSAVEELTLFHGHYFQYPLYEAFLWTVIWTAFSCLRYFRNDRGESVIEQGISKVRVSQRKRNGLRFLALWGAMNIMYIVLYNLPVAIIGGLHPDEFPEDIQQRSYFVEQVCGEGTGYACPGPAVPKTHGDSAHLDENYRLVVPDGTELPTPVPFAR